MLKYYRRLFVTAFRHSFGVADFISSLIGLFGPILARLLGSKGLEDAVGTLAWQIPACAFGALFFARLVLAPYWMHKEDAAQAAKTERELEEARATQARADRRDAIVACLAKLLEAAKELLRRPRATEEEATRWVDDANAWYRIAQDEIREICGDSFLARFTTTNVTAGFFPNVHEKAQHATNVMRKLIENLARLLESQMGNQG